MLPVPVEDYGAIISAACGSLSKRLMQRRQIDACYPISGNAEFC